MFETYMVEYITYAFRKKTKICSFTPYQKVQRNQKKLPVSINCFQTVENNKIMDISSAQMN